MKITPYDRVYGAWRFCRKFSKAATTFFKQAIDGNGLLERVAMDKSGTNLAGLENINVPLVLAGRTLPAYQQFINLAG